MGWKCRRAHSSCARFRVVIISVVLSRAGKVRLLIAQCLHSEGAALSACRRIDS